MPRKSSEATEGLYRKPRANVYTALLFVAFVALVLGSVALYLEMKEYNFEFRGAPSVSAVVGPASGLAQADLSIRPSHGPLV